MMNRTIVVLCGVLFAKSLHAQTACSWTTTTPNITETCGNVGIGISAPIDKLSIVRTEPATSLVSASAIRVANNQGAGYFTNLHFAGLLSDAWIGQLDQSTPALHRLSLSASAAEDLVVLGNGNVGIGTTSPTTLLEVRGNAGPNTIRLGGDGTSVDRAYGLTQILTDASFAYPINAFYTNHTNNARSNELFRIHSGETAAGATAFRVTTGGAIGSPTTTALVVNAGNGYVGIGTAAPTSKLDVWHGTAGNNVVAELADIGYANDAARRISFWQMSNGGGPTTLDQFLLLNGKLDISNSTYGAPKCTSAYTGCTGFWVSDGGLTIITRNTAGTNVTPISAITILSSNGNVGIGNPAPAAKLDVVGTINATGAITGGVIRAKYQDIAEWVPSRTPLAPGTVVVLSRELENTVVTSQTAYDTTVAGVVSAEPGLALGEADATKSLVATTGRVRVHADASSQPIQIGDLLVTGSKPGTAMKSVPIEIAGRRIHEPGTILGKALEPLASGEGEILVLLTLQ